MDTKEEDIGDISLNHITQGPVFGDEQATPSLIDNQWITQLFEKATRLAPRGVVEKWVMGKSPKEIARETGEPLELIYKLLKELEKAITEETDN